MLQAKINDYRISLVGQISHTEAKLIDGKRNHLAIEAIEKLKNATYDNPQLYTSHLQDIVNSGEFKARNDGATPISNRRTTSDNVTNFS